MKVLRCLAVLILIATSPITLFAASQYHEDFLSTTYRDEAETTADWDTLNGELKLRSLDLDVVSSMTGFTANDLALHGNLLYVASGTGGVQIVDVSDPHSPSTIGIIATAGTAKGLCLAGRVLYIAAGSAGLLCYDINDPDSPSLLGSYDTAGDACDLVFDRGHILLADSGYSLVIDVRVPASPEYLTMLTLSGTAVAVDVDGLYAFVADSTGYVRVINISDLNSPAAAGSYTAATGVLDVRVRGNLLYAAAGSQGVIALDISSPPSPVLVGVGDTPGTATGLMLDGEYIYVADAASGLGLYRADDDGIPVYVDDRESSGTATNSILVGEHVFLADGSGGLIGMKAATRIAPDIVGTLSSTGWVYDIVVAGRIMYVASGSAFTSYDLSDPESPTYLDSLTYSDCRYIVVTGDYAYLGNGYSGMTVVDISDPSDLIQKGSYNSYCGALAVSGNVVFASNRISPFSMNVLDVSNPLTPTLISNYTQIDRYSRMVVSGHHLINAAEGSGLEIVDISDVTSLSRVSSVGTPGLISNLAVHGDRAYSVYSATLYCYDITDYSSPSLDSMIVLTGQSWDLCMVGDLLYVGEGSSLTTFDFSSPGSPVQETYSLDHDSRFMTSTGEHLLLGTLDNEILSVRVKIHEGPDPSANRGQSLSLEALGQDIYTAKFSATYTDTINWSISSDGGENWLDVTAFDTWIPFSHVGDDLRWRGVLETNTMSVNPVCTSLDISWMHGFASIDSIVDVPDDQGGWLRVYFTRSGLDFTGLPGHRATGYHLFRRVDDVLLRDRIFDDGDQKTDFSAPTGAYALNLDERTFVASNQKGDFPSGVWEVVASVPAFQQPQYVCLASSLADSSETIEWTAYCTGTSTTDPDTWFISPPDSSYSIDNIEPAAPLGFALDYAATANTLGWDANSEQDFHYYRIYRGETSDFTPGAGNLVHTTVSTSWTDESVESGWSHFYKISAVDDATNESEIVPPGATTSAPEAPATAILAFHGNAPNPFNPSTTISFEVPAGGELIRLAVYDVQGRLVRMLIDERLDSGRHDAVWNGRDGADRRVGAGLYFCRLVADGKAITAKMLLLP